jgi:hypothetical protein
VSGRTKLLIIESFYNPTFAFILSYQVPVPSLQIFKIGTRSRILKPKIELIVGMKMNINIV